jgi:5-methylcytosine-specific restriction endonuclease McrA
MKVMNSNSPEYKHQWYLKNREQVRARMVLWNQANPEYRREYFKKWYSKNRDKAIARARKWQNENREKRNENRRIKYKENPDLRLNEKVRRRVRKYGNGLVERIYRSVVWARDDGICGICGKPVNKQDWQLDHVIPIAKGGTHTYVNVQVSHPICNLKKGDRI